MNLYGLFIVLGIIAGCLVVKKLNKELSISNILPWIFVPGILGARLYHVLDYWNYYGQNLKEIFFIWQGGLGIFGGIIGGIVGLYLYCFYFEVCFARQSITTRFSKRRRIDPAILKKFLAPANLRKHSRIYCLARKLNKKFNFNLINERFLSLLDLGVVGLALGQAIGRWGNFFNQELYGLPTTLPWGIFIKPENRLIGLEGFSKFHPLFLYESLGCLMIFFILFYFARQQNLASGKLFFLYLIMYGILRFFLEFLRPIGWEWQGLRVNQLTAIIVGLIGSLGILIKNGRIKT